MEIGKHNLNEYGNVVRSYNGITGKIITSSEEYSGIFLVGQLTSGKIILIINIELKSGQSLVIPLDFKNCKFEGITEDGWHISSEKISYEINNLTESHGNIFSRTYVLGDLQIVKDEFKFPCTCESIITNYLFKGNPPKLDKISIENPFFDPISIERLPEYENNEVTIQALHDIRPTVKLSFIIKSSDELDQFEDFLNYICMLLSVSRGTHVQWLYYGFNDLDGTDFSYTHKSLISRPYSGGQNIPISPSIGIMSRDQDFLKKSINNFQKYLQNTRVLTSLVNGFLESRVDDFIENKGIALAIEFERIKEYALYVSKIQIRPNIIEDERQESELYENIKELIRQSFPGDDNKEIRNKLYRNRKCMNHTSFRELLESILIELGIPITEELNLVIDSRDNLIHTGRFYCVNNDQKTGKTASLDDCYKEYLTVLKLLDTVILRLFETDLLLD